MSQTTSIEWTDRTWNPVRGCSRISPGCKHCYAEKIAARFHRSTFKGFATSKGWTGKVELVLGKLAEPCHWKKPRRVFVNSMSDLFHESLAPEIIAELFGVMARCPQHTFQILTKRADVMRAWFGGDWAHRAVMGAAEDYRVKWPLPNVWLGVSVEDQATADQRIPDLLATPAAVRFLSCEPLLGAIRIGDLLAEHGRRHIGAKMGIGWVIVGGESGRGARPCDRSWVTNLVAQCVGARVPVFVKQLGSHVVDRNDVGFDGDGDDVWDVKCLDRVEDIDTGYQGAPVRVRLKHPKGGDPKEWPESLRVREFPGPT